MPSFPLRLAGAVERLDRSTAEARRAVYERARKAVAELRSNQPALLDAEITEANPLARRAGEIASGTISRILGFASLVFGRRSESYEKRIPALLKAMRGLQDTRTFDVGTETALEYVKAAKELASRGGFRHVDRHAHELGPGFRELDALARSRLGIGRVGHRHRLNDDRRAAAHLDVTDLHAHGLMEPYN